MEDDFTAFFHETITPSDDDELPNDIQSIIIIDGGDVSVTDRSGNTITYASIPAFTTFANFRPFSINATGTTATNIIAIRPPLRTPSGTLPIPPLGDFSASDFSPSDFDT